MMSRMFRAPSAFSFPLYSLLTLILIAVGPIGCRRAVSLQGTFPPLELRSISFSPSGTIPKKYSSCGPYGSISPELSWSAPPVRTRSFALIVTDEDSPPCWFSGCFVHWVLYNIPSGSRELTEGLMKQDMLPDGSRQGLNGFGKVGYVGPCPPLGSHRYVFALYALDTRLDVSPGPSKKQVENAMRGHILAEGQLMGRFRR